MIASETREMSRPAFGLWPRVAIVVVALALALAPAAAWIVGTWGSSPLDAWGWLFFAAALGWGGLVLALGLADGHPEGLDPSGWPLLFGFVLLAGAGLMLDVRLAGALAGLGLGWAAAWLLLGGAAGVLLLPSLLVAALGLPTIGFLLDGAWRGLGLPAMPALVLKAGLALVLLLGGLMLVVLRRRGRLPLPGPLQSVYGVALVTAAAALTVAFNPPTFGPPLALAEDQWAFGRWYGAEIQAAPSEQRLFADSRRLSKRIYASRDGARVSVLVVESDDVHDLHTPEYCLSGSGWVIGKPESGAPVSPAGGEALPLTAAAVEITAARGEQRLAGVYWFSSASRSTPDLTGLRLQSRLAPEEPFALYLISAVVPAGASARTPLIAFLREAPWLAAPRGAVDDNG